MHFDGQLAFVQFCKGDVSQHESVFGAKGKCVWQWLATGLGNLSFKGVLKVGGSAK